MARGPKKHLKRLAAPKSWMLDKLGGVFAPRPSPGPHKLRESLPLIIMLRNKLKYAISRVEVEKIVKQRTIKVDGKIRTDMTFPAGYMDSLWSLPSLFPYEDISEVALPKAGTFHRHDDHQFRLFCISVSNCHISLIYPPFQYYNTTDVISIARTEEYFRILYDVKGRFILHRITPVEASYKLCRVKRVGTGGKGVPYLVTHDGRTIRYPDPLIKVHDTIRLDVASGKILEFIKFETGNLCMVTGGHNLGRIGVITHRERHPGNFDVVNVKDSLGHTFATRINYIFVIGKGTKPYISLPKGKGVKLSVAEERDRRIAKKTK